MSNLTVYSYCFYRFRGLVGTPQLIIPQGYTAVIRDVEVYFNASAGTHGNLDVQDYGTGATLLHFAATVPPAYAAQWQGHIVIGAGVTEGIVVNVPGPDPWDVVISGYLLTGTAPVQIAGSPAP